MSDETKTPDTLTPADAPEQAPEPEVETNDALEATDTDGGIWRCLNERCPDAMQGKTFVGPTQQTVQATGEHVVCPGCKNDPAPHYIFVNANDAQNAA